MAKKTKAPDTGAILDSTCATSEVPQVSKPATSEVVDAKKVSKSATSEGAPAKKRKPGTENVIPYKFRKGDPRAIAAGKKGGAAAAEKLRKRKAIKEDLDDLLSRPITDKRQLKRLTSIGYQPEDVSQQMAMLQGLLLAAIKGDARAAKVLIDILGEDSKPAAEGVQIVDDL